MQCWYFDRQFAPSKLQFKFQFAAWANGFSYWNIVSWLRWKATLPLFQRGKINCSFLESFQLKVLPSSDSWQSSDGVKVFLVQVSILQCMPFLVVVAVSFKNFSKELVSHFPWLSGVLAFKSQSHMSKEMCVRKFLASAAVHVKQCLRKSPTVHPCTRSWFSRRGYLWEHNRFLHLL